MRKFHGWTVATVALGLGLGLLAGCAAAPADGGPASSEDAISLSKVKLPANDPCRDVLAPLALGIADGAVGASANAITVSLTSETDTRLYTVSVARGAQTTRYEVELDNDSASLCFLDSVKPSDAATLENDARAAAKASELAVTAPIAVSPADDDCLSTVKLLAQAAAVSAVGANLEKVDVKLESATETREYSVAVDGRAFQANGQTFPNDAKFTIEVSNDSASKCWVESVTHD